MLIKETIHNNIITNVATNTGNKYLVFDAKGKEILSIENGWSTNHYSVAVNGKNILAVKWDETNSRPLTADQKDMIDIINACKEKIDLQETAQTMTPKEIELARFLQTSLCSMKH